MRRRPFYGLAALALGTALTVAGCSGDGGSATSASPKTSTTVSSAAGGGTAENAALTADTFATRLADAQKTESSAQVSMTMSAAGQKITADATVDLSGETVAMDETVNIPGMMPKATVRAVDGMVYMNLGELSKNKWIEIDPSDTSDPLASQFTGMLDGADPTKQLEGLKGAITSLEKSGSPEKVDGVDAQKYVLTVDTSKLGGALKSQVGAAGASLPKTITYTYWVDGDDLMRKIEADVAGAKVEMHFSHWGEPVTITAPPKGDILSGGLEDLTALAS